MLSVWVKTQGVGAKAKQCKRTGLRNTNVDELVDNGWTRSSLFLEHSFPPIHTFFFSR